MLTYVLTTFLKGGLTVDEVVVIGCDVHERTMRLKASVGREAPVRRTFHNTSIAAR